eukprot:COSAG06_NODE_65554_length_256_cov_1.649682_1_plen_60_part_10
MPPVTAGIHGPSARAYMCQADLKVLVSHAEEVVVVCGYRWVGFAGRATPRASLQRVGSAG